MAALRQANGTGSGHPDNHSPGQAAFSPLASIKNQTISVVVEASAKHPPHELLACGSVA
jgi:hypothetical protein